MDDFIFYQNNLSIDPLDILLKHINLDLLPLDLPLKDHPSFFQSDIYFFFCLKLYDFIFFCKLGVQIFFDFIFYELQNIIVFPALYQRLFGLILLMLPLVNAKRTVTYPTIKEQLEMHFIVKLKMTAGAQQ